MMSPPPHQITDCEYVKNTITCNVIEWSQEIDMEYIELNITYADLSV